MKPGPFLRVGARAEERPRCLACGTFVEAPPEAETSTRHGDFAIVVSWRICTCGAFVRTQSVVVLERDGTAIARDPSISA